MVRLRAYLEGNGSFGKIKEEGESLVAYLNEPLEASVLNEMLFKEGIVLSKLDKRKESLEEQFLELTNKIEQHA